MPSKKNKSDFDMIFTVRPVLDWKFFVLQCVVCFLCALGGALLGVHL